MNKYVEKCKVVLVKVMRRNISYYSLSLYPNVIFAANIALLYSILSS